jgi:aconitate hydratase 2 / 2-methylisocitrate dehydratase
MTIVGNKLNPLAAELYRYLNFNEIAGFSEEGRVVSKEEEAKLVASI